MNNETVKSRTFSLSLSNQEVIKLFEKAARVGETPEELLAGFIADLIDGRKTHGSDERMYASEWYRRTYCYEYESSFLCYIIDWDRYSEVIDCIDDYDDWKEKIKTVENDTEKLFYEKEMEYCINDLTEIFEEYRETTKQNESFEAAIEQVREYDKRLVSVLRRNQ